MFTLMGLLQVFLKFIEKIKMENSLQAISTNHCAWKRISWLQKDVLQEPVKHGSTHHSESNSPDTVNIQLQ